AMLGGFGDDGGDEDPEQMMDYMDTDDDGYLSLQELIDYLNNDREQNGEPPMSSEDEEGTANWFYSGDTDGDDLLSLDEFAQLLESTGDDDDGDDGNDVYWQSYEGGHCEWEGDADGEENAWYCKYSEETEWNTWWYYCENHDSDWHCTDDFGQSEDYEYSADGTEWCESFDCGDDGDDDGPPTPEEAMEAADANDDGYVSLQEFEDFWESDPSNPELDSDAIATLFDDCDYDGNDLIDIDEVQCFIDGIGDMFDPGEANPEQIFDWMDADDDGQVTASEWADFANTSGDIIEGDDFDNLISMMDMYDYDNSDGLDIYEFAELWDEIMSDDDDGDDGDGEGGNDEPSRVTMMVMDQTLNAPISDFEVRFLVDCGEPDEEGNEPPISNCTIAASNGLTEGSATVDPAIAEYEFTYEYLDYDGDGLISDMDTLVIDNLMPGVQVELYDTWADQYTSDSFATAEMLPGFGALMAVVVLLGAALATRRD
ncbi:MAG: EF-hand domain-containing protein, partial [Candidatus Thalassarchaeum sp.]|nr:EF-hand domain-containing protein [Candidatus Thalassarchaeum sp.]